MLKGRFLLQIASAVWNFGSEHIRILRRFLFHLLLSYGSTPATRSLTMCECLFAPVFPSLDPIAWYQACVCCCLLSEGKWKPWGNWSVCAVEGFQIRRRNCSKEPCLGERLQERICTPTNERCEGRLHSAA